MFRGPQSRLFVLIYVRLAFNDDGASDLVMPALFTTVKTDPDKSKAEGQQADVVGEIANNVLGGAGRAKGFGIDYDGLEQHFARRRIFEYPKQDKDRTHQQQIKAHLSR